MRVLTSKTVSPQFRAIARQAYRPKGRTHPRTRRAIAIAFTLSWVEFRTSGFCDALGAGPPEGAMSNTKISNIKIVTLIVLATALAGAAYAYAGQGGGGGGGGHGGGYGGGGAYYGRGGGGSYYGGGGGMPYARDGGDRFDGGTRMRDTARFEGAPRYADRPAMSHFAGRPYFGHRLPLAIHGRPDFNRHRAIGVSRNRNSPTLRSDRSANLRSNARRSALSVGAGAPRDTANLRFPNARAQIVTTAATAGRQDARGGYGWARHRHGGFGWVGPLFWPFAYHDISDYALWGYGTDDPFWDYGYSDIYAGIFIPYGDDDLIGGRPQKAGSGGGPRVNARPHGAVTPQPRAVSAHPYAAVAARPPAAVAAQPSSADTAQPAAAVAAKPPAAVTAQQPAAVAAQPPAAINAQPPAAVNARTRSAQAALPDHLAQMCGDDSRDIAGFPIDRIQTAIAPNDRQRAALDDLANASVKAAETIRTACPTEVALTAPGRLAVMQQRIEAMIAAVDIIQPALRTFNDLLNDEQKTRLNALSNDQGGEPTARNSNDGFAGTCDASQAQVPALPSAEIEAKIHPTEAQRQSLVALRDATARAADMLNIPCPMRAEVIAPPARLEAVHKRLVLTQQAITIVLAALDDFYGELSEDQKAQFEAIRQHEPAADQPGAARNRGRRPHVGFGGDVRHVTSMAQR
jgi:LTXXQ motif family protein